MRNLRLPLMFLIGLSAWNPPARARDRLSNISASFTRQPSRAAMIGTADGLFYNPSGTVDLPPGVHLNISNQTFFLDVRNTFAGQNYQTNTVVPVFPGLFGVYATQDWAFYSALTVPGGAGVVDYDKGSTSSLGMSSIEGFGAVAGWTVGAAHRLSEHVSVAAGLTAVYGFTETKLTRLSGSPLGAQGERRDSGLGVGGHVGVNVTPTRNLRAAATFHSNIPMKYTIVRSNVPLALGASTGEGLRYRDDIPPDLRLGVDYHVSPEWLWSVSTDIYPHTFWTRTTNPGETTNRASQLRRNGFAVAAGSTYRFSPSLEVSGGVRYYDSGAKGATLNPEFPDLGSLSVGAGGRLFVSPHLSLSLGGMVSLGNLSPDPIETPFGPAEVTRFIVRFFSLSLDYHFDTQ